MLSMSVRRSAPARRTSLHVPDLATEEPATAQDPNLVAGPRQPVLATAQRELLPLAVVSSAEALGNVAVLALRAVTRTIGLPFGLSLSGADA